MRKAFFTACGVAALAFWVHAAFAPFYENGIAAFLAPIFFALVAGMFGALLLRKGWSWRMASSWCLVWVILGLVFPPMPVHFGAATTFARVLVGVEVIACASIFLLMLSPTIKGWFHASIGN